MLGDFQLAVAEQAEHVLAGMGDRLKTRQAEEPAGPLDGVDQAEDIAQRLAVVRVAFQLDQLDVRHIEALDGLGDEFA